MEDGAVTLDEARVDDAELLENLLQLYIHDLSAIFTQVELGSNGRFAYPQLGAYLAASESKRAFVVRHAGQLAGFALVKRGSPFVDDPDVWDIGEFFVLRRFRGQGVGRVAARLIWERLSGRWSVRVAQKNAAAIPFWRRAVADYSRGAAQERVHYSGPDAWTVFTF